MCCKMVRVEASTTEKDCDGMIESVNGCVVVVCV